MSIRKIIDAKHNGEKVWLKGHAQATFMSDGSTVEDAINNMKAEDGGITTETDPIFSASPAAKITDNNISSWNNKVDKVDGKQLSTEDFTTVLMNKLSGLNNYDDTAINQAVQSLQTQLDTLVSGNASTAIDSFNEIIAFLNGITDSQSLDSIIASIEQQIAGKMDKVTLAAVATSGNYNDLSNKPTIPSAVTESTVSGWGFTKNTGTYSKPSTGIPKSDLASAVQTSLGKADTALQSYTEQYKGTITGVSANGTSVATSGVANIPAASTSAYGVTKLSSSTSSTSTTLAATASAVKAAYDLANGKQAKLVSGTNIKTINGESILGSGDIVINSSSSEETTIDNGVYAVTADEKLIDYNEADDSCIGVALVAGEHKFMIAKSDATNDGSNYNLYYDYDKGDLSLTNYSNADGTNNYGYLGGSSTPQLSQDFTTWTEGALSDFNGKTNTQVIAASSSNAKDMCKVLETFNAGSDNQGHNDWYVPACGQLALMYLAKTDINAALAKIGGTAFESSYYWSSSEKTSNYAWVVGFDDGNVNYGDKDYFSRVRFVRDLSTPKSLKEIVSELESNKQDTLISGTNIKTINGNSILGSGNIVISGGGSSSGGGGAYAEVNHGASDTTFTLTPNTFHVWDEVASLDLSFAEEQAGVANEYLFQFTSGATATTLTLPDGLKWANDITPTIAKNMIYQVSVLKGLASVLEFANEDTLLVFYILKDAETYTVNMEDGMTWREWCASEYNTIGCSISGSAITFGSGYFISGATSSSTIEAFKTYECYFD